MLNPVSLSTSAQLSGMLTKWSLAQSSIGPVLSQHGIAEPGRCAFSGFDNQLTGHVRCVAIVRGVRHRHDHVYVQLSIQLDVALHMVLHPACVALSYSARPAAELLVYG